MVAVLIIMTFITFYLLPLCVMKFSLRLTPPLTKRKCIIHEGMAIMVITGMLSDALVYIFLTKHFRDVIIGMFSSCKNRPNTDISAQSNNQIYTVSTSV